MPLNDDNFIIAAMKSYDNAQCHTVQEFEEDLKRFQYLRKLLKRYKKDGELRERLILNHIIILFNLFGAATTDMLFFKVEEEYWSTLATFLLYLNRISEEKAAELSLDQTIVTALRKI